MSTDTNLVVVILALGAVLYGIYSKSSRSAGYDVTPPPLREKETTLVSTTLLPGVPESFLRACARAVDSPGATLVGPVAPKGIDPDRVKDLASTIVKRIKNDVVCTAIDGWSCVADAEGSEQHDIRCVVYDKDSNAAIQLDTSLIMLDDGRLMITKLVPASKVVTDTFAHATPFKLEHTPYSFPIDGV
jgi:hypothetical protein